MAEAERHPPRLLKIVKKHVFQFLFGAYQAHPELRQQHFRCKSAAEVATILGRLTDAVAQDVAAARAAPADVAADDAIVAGDAATQSADNGEGSAAAGAGDAVGGGHGDASAVVSVKLAGPEGTPGVWYARHWKRTKKKGAKRPRPDDSADGATGGSSKPGTKRSKPA